MQHVAGGSGRLSDVIDHGFTAADSVKDSDMAKKPSLAQLQRERDHAKTYSEWADISQDMDILSGADDWRAEETSDDYDWWLIRERLVEIRRLRRLGDARQLAFGLHEGLHGNIGNMGNGALYQ